MNYKNFITIEDYSGDEIYLRDCFNEGMSANNYEIFDVDLIATEIGRYILDERDGADLIDEDGPYDKLFQLICNCVDDYIDDFRENLIMNVEEFVYLNFK